MASGRRSSTGGLPLDPEADIIALDQQAVRAFYDAALAHGGCDNGVPGLRPRYHDRYFAAFVLDPDGNNIEAVIQ